MRVIVIDPDARTVEDREVEGDLVTWQKLVGNGWVTGHYIVPEVLPDHICLVDEDGIPKRKTAWFFNNCMIWGPMVILTRGGQGFGPARVNVEQVEPYVQFR